MVLSVEKTNLNEKIDKFIVILKIIIREIFEHKQSKKQEKSKTLELKIEELQKQLDEYKKDFEKYFNKPKKDEESVINS